MLKKEQDIGNHMFYTDGVHVCCIDNGLYKSNVKSLN